MVVPPVRAFPSHGPFSPGPWCVPAEERREGSPEGEVLAAFSGEVTLVSRPPPGTGGNPKRCMRRPCSLAASSGGGGRTSDLFFSSGVQTPHFTALARMDQDETRPPRLRGCRERRQHRSGNWYISCRTLGPSEANRERNRQREGETGECRGPHTSQEGACETVLAHPSPALKPPERPSRLSASRAREQTALVRYEQAKNYNEGPGWYLARPGEKQGARRLAERPGRLPSPSRPEEEVTVAAVSASLIRTPPASSRTAASTSLLDGRERWRRRGWWTPRPR